MLDADAELCQCDVITGSVPMDMEPMPSVSMTESDVTKTKRGGVRPGSGRPVITSERPWQAEGVSRMTYYRRQAPRPIVTPAYATDIPRWFCIRLPSASNDAALDADVAIREDGFETFYPQEWVPPVAAHRTEAGRAIPARSERLVPLLRSYALVRFDRTDQSWRRLAAFGQVLGATPEWPTPIPDSDISALRKGLGANGVLYPEAAAKSSGAKKRWVDMATALLQFVGAE